MNISMIADLMGGSFAIVLISLVLVLALASRLKSEHDRLRFKLFAVRDKLAIMAASGDIDVRSKAYELLRTFLNQSLRHTHRFGAHEYALFVNRPKTTPDEELSEAIQALSPQARDQWVRLAMESVSVALEIIRYNSRLVRITNRLEKLATPRRSQAVERQEPVRAFRKLNRSLDELKSHPAAA